MDGHRFIPDVFEKGALAVLSEEPLENPAGPYIQVASSEQALKDIAEFTVPHFLSKLSELPEVLEKQVQKK